MRLKIVLPVLVLVATIFGALTLLATSPRLEPSQPEAILTSVRTMEVLPEQISMVVHSQGTVAPRTEADVVPEVSGKVVWISPNLVSGGSFEAQEVLLRIDNRDYAASAGRARAALERARAEDEHARFELGRLEQLESRQLASRSQMENTLRAARVSQANLSDARLMLEQAERRPRPDRNSHSFYRPGAHRTCGRRSVCQSRRDCRHRVCHRLRRSAPAHSRRTARLSECSVELPR